MFFSDAYFGMFLLSLRRLFIPCLVFTHGDEANYFF
jgi:hypothetical protein